MFGGLKMNIRGIKFEDAALFLDLCKKLDEETEFMLFEPDERKLTYDDQRERISNIINSGHSMIFVAEEDGQIVGQLSALGSNLNRTRHSIYLVIGILQRYSGQGIGTRLFRELEIWAREKGIHRIELTVMTHNEAAIGIYKKMGFQVEGIKKDSIKIRNQFFDEYYMARILW
jgi:RimJ/RimL family protein N-acetyltransferase